MDEDHIKHLASLARITLSAEEQAKLQEELPTIVEYVSAVSEIVGDDAERAPQLGARYNILRADAVTNDPDSYSKAIIEQMPETDGRYLKVKKILKTDE